MSTVSSFYANAREQVRDYHLKAQLQEGFNRPLVDLRKHQRLPAKLDHLAGRVQLLRLCVTPEFFEENKGKIVSLGKRVSLKCHVLPLVGSLTK